METFVTSYKRENLTIHTKEKKVIMKKLIQVSGLMGLLVILTAATTFAQTSYGTDINIPFAFTINDRSYEAGDYIVKIEKLVTGAASLSITDAKTEEVQRVLMNVNGDSVVSGEVKLVFDTIDGQRYLTKVRTPDRSYALLKSKAEKDALKARNGKGADVSGTSTVY